MILKNTKGSLVGKFSAKSVQIANFKGLCLGFDEYLEEGKIRKTFLKLSAIDGYKLIKDDGTAVVLKGSLFDIANLIKDAVATNPDVTEEVAEETENDDTPDSGNNDEGDGEVDGTDGTGTTNPTTTENNNDENMMNIDIVVTHVVDENPLAEPAIDVTLKYPLTQKGVKVSQIIADLKATEEYKLAADAAGCDIEGIASLADSTVLKEKARILESTALACVWNVANLEPVDGAGDNADSQQNA